MSTMEELNGLPKLPSTWSWSTINAACLKVQDGTHFSPQNQLAQGAYRYITAKNVRPSGLDLSDVSYLAEDEHRVIYKRCDPKKGDVLLVKDGVNTGDAAVNTLEEEFSLLSSVCLLRPRPAILYSQFLRYYLLSPVGYRMLTGQMTGTAIKRIILGRIKESPVPIAPLDEQRTIVAEIEKQFSRLDEAVANLKRVKANLKRYKASVLKSAVEGKLTEEWRKQHPNVEPASKLLECIFTERRAKWKKKSKEQVEPDVSDLPLLPEGWIWTSLDNIVEDSLIGLDRGRAQQSNSPGSGVPYIKMNNVTVDGRVFYRNLAFVQASGEEQARYSLCDGDLLFNTRNSKELVGKVGLVRNPPQGSVYNNNLMRIRMPIGIEAAFICAQMCSHGFRMKMELVKKATTNVAAVYAKDLFPLTLALPPTAEQQHIVAEVERRLSVIEELDATVEANLTRADRLRQSILQQAFSGRLLSEKGHAGSSDSHLPLLAAESVSPYGVRS